MTGGSTFAKIMKAMGAFVHDSAYCCGRDVLLMFHEIAYDNNHGQGEGDIPKAIIFRSLLCRSL